MLKRTISFVIILAVTACVIFPAPCATGEELQYRKVSLDDVSCDIGIRYADTSEGMDVAVSAIALGWGTEFRHWRIDKIKLRIGNARIRPDKNELFFVRKESFWRIPAAVLWAVIGAMYESPEGTSQFDKVLTNIGLAAGLGILTLQAKGDIPGQKCVFHLKKDIAEKIAYGKDSIVISLNDEYTHESYDIRIGMTKAPAGEKNGPDYSGMSKEELQKTMMKIDEQATALEKDLSLYKYGQDPKYDDIQSRIESLRSEQARAYKAWTEK
jgi:hypothetical protein